MPNIGVCGDCLADLLMHMLDTKVEIFTENGVARHGTLKGFKVDGKRLKVLVEVKKNRYVVLDNVVRVNFSKNPLGIRSIQRVGGCIGERAESFNAPAPQTENKNLGR